MLFVICLKLRCKRVGQQPARVKTKRHAERDAAQRLWQIITNQKA